MGDSRDRSPTRQGLLSWASRAIKAVAAAVTRRVDSSVPDYALTPVDTTGAVCQRPVGLPFGHPVAEVCPRGNKQRHGEEEESPALETMPDLSL